MSRSGYSEDLANWDLIRWRGAVISAIRGKRGQAFLKEMLASLDAMPEKKLITDQLIDSNGATCAIGTVCKSRGLDVSNVNVENPHEVADLVGIARAMAAEIEFVNDEDCWWSESDEDRFIRVRDWVKKHISAIKL